MRPHTRWLELDLKHRGARRITTFCRRGDVKANQLDDDQTNRVILSSSSADVNAPISIRSVTAESTACGRGASTARFKNEAHVGNGAPLL